MKPNTTWEVQLPSFRQGDKSLNAISPLNTKVVGFDKFVPTLVISNDLFGEEGRREKKMEEAAGDLFYSITGQDSHSSFMTASTEPPSQDASRKLKSSSRDTSRKSKSSRSRRKPRRQSLPVASTTAFDPTRTPQKSCMKKHPKTPSHPSKRRLRIQGSSYKVYLPAGLRSIKRQRSIQFNDEVSVREVRSSKSLVNDNPRVLWWQDDEHESIKDNLQRLLSRVNRWGVSRTNGRKYCTRGLERFLTPDDWESDRIEAEDAVIREQAHQRDIGTFDDLRIAAVYFRSTRTSLQRATRRGCEDALLANSILKEESSCFRTSTSSGSLNVSIGLSGVSRLPARSLLPHRSSSFSVLPRRSTSFQHDQELKSQSFHRRRSLMTSTDDLSS